MTNEVSEIKRTTHTQKGYALFVVQLCSRVSRPEFHRILAEAKALGGWWSSYAVDGAIPGFQFKTETAAAAFQHVMQGRPSLEQARAQDAAESHAGPARAIVNAGDKLRDMAEALTPKIEHLRRDMTQNPTPKRNYQYRSRLHDANNMERTQQALLALADAHDAGTVPPVLAGIRTKAQIEPLVSKGTESGGYYDCIPSSKYRDQSPAGLALQAMIDKGPQGNAQEAKARE